MHKALQFAHFWFEHFHSLLVDFNSVWLIITFNLKNKEAILVIINFMEPLREMEIGSRNLDISVVKVKNVEFD